MGKRGLKFEGRRKISHERIYQHIYADKRDGGDLYTVLRCQKQRKKLVAEGEGAYHHQGQRPGVLQSRQSG